MSREFWDERFSGDAFVYGELPNRFLVANAHLFAKGSDILLPGDGEGRNSVWLAKQGHRVTAVDYSKIALDKGQHWAAQNGVSIHSHCSDLIDFSWPEKAYQGIVSIFVHLPPEIRKQIHQKMARALKPGGILLLQAFHPDQLQYHSGGPKDISMLYSREMLLDDFAEFGKTEISAETVEMDESDFHSGTAAVINLIFTRE